MSGCRRSVSPAFSSVFVPSTAVLTCQHHQFAAIKPPKVFSVCVHTYCVTAMWLNGEPRGSGGYAHRDLWPAPHLTVCWLWRAQKLQLSNLRLSAPPFTARRQSAPTRCLHTLTKTCVDALHTNTYSLKQAPPPEDKLGPLNNHCRFSFLYLDKFCHSLSI